MLITLGMFWIQIFEIHPELDVAGYLPVYLLETEVDSVIAPLLCMLMVCMKLHR